MIRKMALTRQVVCDSCNGAGTNSGRKYECPTCSGTGVEVVMRPLGPGMVQQIQRPCTACGGNGFMVPPTDKCKKCAGKGLLPEKKLFEVVIEQGMKNGQKITLRGEAGCSEPGVTPGDVVFVIEQREHERFKRAGPDLIYQQTISLKDAICGTTLHVKHLDGRFLRVVIEPGEVIKPDSWRCIEEEGMPIHGRSWGKGNIYMQFEVEFPESIDIKTVASLRKYLPGASMAENGAMDSDDVEDVTTKVIGTTQAMQEELKARARFLRDSTGEAYNSDDEDDLPRGAVRCAQQ